MLKENVSRREQTMIPSKKGRNHEMLVNSVDLTGYLFWNKLIDKKTKLINKKSTPRKSTNKLGQNMEQGNVVDQQFW